MDEPKLKSCPLCGTIPKIYISQDKSSCQIKCNCEIVTYHLPKEKAIKEWNDEIESFEETEYIRMQEEIDRLEPNLYDM